MILLLFGRVKQCSFFCVHCSAFFIVIFGDGGLLYRSGFGDVWGVYGGGFQWWLGAVLVVVLATEIRLWRGAREMVFTAKEDEMERKFSVLISCFGRESWCVFRAWA